MSDSDKAVLEKFGRLLMKSARDVPIRQFDMLVAGKMKDHYSRRLHEKLARFGEQEGHVVREVFIHAVNETLHHMLWMIEQSEEFDIVAETDEGRVISLRDTSDGLSGELYTSDGWVANFSEFKEED